VSVEEEYQQILKKVTAQLESSRKKRGMTQKDVAFACEMEEQNYRRVEKGLTNPTLKSLVRICAALEINLKDLL